MSRGIESVPAKSKCSRVDLRMLLDSDALCFQLGINYSKEPENNRSYCMQLTWKTSGSYYVLSASLEGQRAN